MTAAITSTPRNAPAKGIVYMLAASATLTIMDAGVKWLTAGYPVPQIGFMRYGIGIFVAVAMAARLGGIATLRTRRLGGHALRSLFNLVTMLTFYYVGWRRWLAVVVGFIGVLIAAQPSAAGINAGALYALAAALFYALTLVTSRQLSTTESSHTILFYYSLFVILALGAGMPWVWVTPRWEDLWLIVFTGVAGSFGQFFLNQAFRYGEVSLLAPLDYSGLVWAGLLGFIVWGDVPTPVVLVGSAIIVSAGIYIVRREAMLRRHAKPPAAPESPQT
jgi:drug/metabolite transporter (DMT)-like permease